MLLLGLEISGFRSFRKAVNIFLSGPTNILIGPNDHGKTNVLMAVERLGPDKEFSPKEVNDRVRDDTPAYLSFRLQFSEAEISSVESEIRPRLPKVFLFTETSLLQLPDTVNA